MKDSKNIKIFEEIYPVNLKITSSKSQKNLRRSLEKNNNKNSYATEPNHLKNI